MTRPRLRSAPAGRRSVGHGRLRRSGHWIRRRKRRSEYTERWLAGLDVLAAVVGAELRCWYRERSSVASAVVLPVALAALVTSVLGGEAPQARFTFAVVDEADDAASAAFVDQALGDPAVAEVVDTQRVANERAADRLLDADDVDALIVLPRDLGTRLAGGAGGAGITVEAAEPLAGDLGAMVVDQYVTRARTTAVALARTGHGPTGEWPLHVELAAPGGQRLDAARHYGPGIGMFFVLVGLGFAAQRLVADRRRGLVDRIATTPAPPVAVAFGRALAVLAIGALSLGSCALAMQVLFERPWGPALPLVVLVAATVLALAGVAAIVAVISRTPEQAALAGSAVAFAFALASGTFSPPGSIGTRPALAELVPTTHALDGFALLATEPPGTGLAGLAPVLLPVGALCAFALAGGVATALLTRLAR